MSDKCSVNGITIGAAAVADDGSKALEGSERGTKDLELSAAGSLNAGAI